MSYWFFLLKIVKLKRIFALNATFVVHEEKVCYNKSHIDVVSIVRDTVSIFALL